MRRILAALLLLYALGLALFSVSLPRPLDPARRTDAIVVLTGGPGRIERGVALLRAGAARRMLISGVDPSVREADLLRRVGTDAATRRLFACCVDLDSVAVDTRSNAEEARRWLDDHHLTTVRLISSDWHLHRAALEFRQALGRRPLLDGVRSEPRFATLFSEYNKYLLRLVMLPFGE